jgi:hypothetical protein
MRCDFENCDATQAERAAVDAWLVATDCTGVTDITIEDLAVVVHGTRNHYGTISGTALRNGDLFAELLAALASMRS